MKRQLTMALVLVATTSSGVLAREGGVNLNINVGAPVIAEPVPVGPRVVLSAAPRFIFSPSLGMYVSVGIPYDIMYIGNAYYVYDNGFWYRGPYYNGPWVRAEGRRLPPVLHRYRFEQIRHFRDEEFHRYEMDRGHYRGRWHEPGFRGGGGEHHDRGEHRGHR